MINPEDMNVEGMERDMSIASHKAYMERCHRDSQEAIKKARERKQAEKISCSYANIIGEIRATEAHLLSFGVLTDEKRKAIDFAIKSINNMQKLERLVSMYKQKGREPQRTVTMEDLAYILDIKDGGEKEWVD